MKRSGSEIEFLGAAQTVTGSLHLLHTPHARVLLDCGLFQGRRQESFERNRHLPVDAARIDAVVLSHAHIDHSGALPLLIKQGYRGSIYTTAASRDLCAAMLEDSARIQEADADYINRKLVGRYSEVDPVEPLYNGDDVVKTLRAMISVSYHQSLAIAPGVKLTFYDAGHVLGSAIPVLDVENDGSHKRIVFSGDLGRRHMPILRDPEVPKGAHFLICESTYGDRLHPPLAQMEEELGKVVKRTSERGGKIIIPSFALERAQEVIYALKRLQRAGLLPSIPIFVDSPLTIKITDVFKLHADCYDAEARKLLTSDDSPFELPNLKYVESVEESKQLDALNGPAIIIAASGMCEAGRVLHHLQSFIGDEKNTVLIVGFQAQHTLGRRLVEGRRKVRIFGLERDRRAEVVVLNGFSAHADRQDLLDFAIALRARGSLEQIALVHGEIAAQNSLRKLLYQHEFSRVHIPIQGERIAV